MDTPYYLQAGETFFAELDPRRCILRVTHRDVVYAFSSERPPFLEAEVDGAVQTIPFDMARSVLNAAPEVAAADDYADLNAHLGAFVDRFADL